MPGTIQVSVLGFKEIQTSSVSSNTSIKRFSMGKREYQTWDTGDFTFALTTLRDKLIIKLIGADGTEMSHIGVETRSIIEKGRLEETFDFEGGGNVHLRLQFVLSEEDRDRIRLVTALRKKHEELVNSNNTAAKTKILRTSLSSPDISGLSSQDSQPRPRKIILAGETSLGTKAVPSPETKLNTRNKNYTDWNHKISSADSQTLRQPNSDPAEVSQSVLQSSSFVSAKIEFSGDGKSEIVSSSKENKDFSKPEETETEIDEKQNPFKKTSSNVRKMISTFEIGLTQVKKPRSAMSRTDSAFKSSDIVEKISLVKSSGSSQNSEKWKMKREENVETDGENALSKNIFKYLDKEVNTESDEPLESQRASNSKSKSSFCRDSERYDVRSSRLWIFPEESRTCITTGGRRENVPGVAKVTDSWISADPENSSGPIGQVMRAAIMVGFATLVLITRQRNYR